MAEVAFRPVHQLSEYKGKGASASRECNCETVPVCKRYQNWHDHPQVSSTGKAQDVRTQYAVRMRLHLCHCLSDFVCLSLVRVTDLVNI